MGQIHRRFTNEQIKVLLDAYEKGHISRGEIEDTLEIGKTRFFALMKKYRESPDTFSMDYHRPSRGRLSSEIEDKIRKELLRDKELLEDKELPITNYNYAALNDRLKKDGVQVSTTTTIKRAKSMGCNKPIKKKKDTHDNEAFEYGEALKIMPPGLLHGIGEAFRF